MEYMPVIIISMSNINIRQALYRHEEGLLDVHVRSWAGALDYVGPGGD